VGLRNRGIRRAGWQKSSGVVVGGRCAQAYMTLRIKKGPPLRLPGLCELFSYGGNLANSAERGVMIPCSTLYRGHQLVEGPDGPEGGGTPDCRWDPVLSRGSSENKVPAQITKNSCHLRTLGGRRILEGPSVISGCKKAPQASHR